MSKKNVFSMDVIKSRKTRRLLSTLNLRGSPVVLVERISFLCGGKNTYKVFSAPEKIISCKPVSEVTTQLPVICEPYTDIEDPLNFSGNDDLSWFLKFLVL